MAVNPPPRAAIRLCLALAALAGACALAGPGGAEALRPALLDAEVNGRRADEPILFLRGDDGSLLAPAAFFAEWRLLLPAEPPRIVDGEPYYRVGALPGARVVLSEADQAVRIEASPAAFARQRAALDAVAPVPMTPPGTGLFLNYDLLLEHADGDTDVGGAFELGLFTKRGTGRVAFLASSARAEGLVRLESGWSIDFPERAASLEIGDSVSIAGPGAAPVRFAGLHYFRNHAVRPGFITMPLPSASGAAAVPSIVDVYVNNVLQGSRPVAPGPFELADIPVQAGGGTVRLVVRDLLGREIVSEQPYYASSGLLRRGLHDFSYAAGFVRRGFGRRGNDYGELMVSTVHRYGFSDRLTGEAQLQASENAQMAGLAATFALSGLGQLGGSASLSRSERGLDYRLAGLFERRTRLLSLGLLAEHHGRDFAFVGMPEGYRLPRLTLQGYADLPLPRGSAGLNLLHRRLDGGPDETVAALAARWQIGARASLQLYARRTVAGAAETAFGGHLAFALGGRRSASAGLEQSRRGAHAYFGYQDDPPSGTGGGFRAGASFGRVERAEAAYVRNFAAATLGAHAAYADGRAGLRLSAAGSVGMMDGELFASRSLGESFAAVEVPGFAGIRVYADDHPVGVTGRDGRLVVPGLRAYEANRLRIDEGDLPIEAQLAAGEIVVRPYARSGTTIRFEVSAERGVLMRVRLADGNALPAGARVRVEGEDGDHLVVAGGEVYVPGLVGRRRLYAAWDGGACVFVAEVPAGDDPQPRLDGLVCEREAAYAAR